MRLRHLPFYTRSSTEWRCEVEGFRFDYELPEELIAQTPLDKETNQGCWYTIGIQKL